MTSSSELTRLSAELVGLLNHGVRSLTSQVLADIKAPMDGDLRERFDALAKEAAAKIRSLAAMSDPEEADQIDVLLAALQRLSAASNRLAAHDALTAVAAAASKFRLSSSGH